MSSKLLIIGILIIAISALIMATTSILTLDLRRAHYNLQRVKKVFHPKQEKNISLPNFSISEQEITSYIEKRLKEKK